jgi:hypothetical protein
MHRLAGGKCWAGKREQVSGAVREMVQVMVQVVPVAAVVVLGHGSISSSITSSGGSGGGGGEDDGGMKLAVGSRQKWVRLVVQ